MINNIYNIYNNNNFRFWLALKCFTSVYRNVRDPLWKLTLRELKWPLSFRKDRLNFCLVGDTLSWHSYSIFLSHWAVLFFFPLHSLKILHTLVQKYLDPLTDVCFMRWTPSGHKGKHRMAETLKGKAKAGDNPFPLYGSRREINGWEFSNITGFRQNISVSTERPDSLK